MTKKIYVTSPLLPPLTELIPDLQKIWDNKILTNNGEFHQKLEAALCSYLGVEYISLFNNATIGLICAIKCLSLSGSVITTPYSFVATTHSLSWCNLNPIFVDIEPQTLNIDPYKIEEAITEDTSAILAVHCYGNPCNVEKINQIASKYKLKVIYDAAHAFGVNDHSGSILRYGDLSILSFHATKTFNTFEGGAIISPSFESKNYIDQLKNFGIVDETTILTEGLNGKMSEFNAAFGLLQLRYIDEAIEKRSNVAAFYRKHLFDIKGLNLLGPEPNFRSNYSYFPIIINDDFSLNRDELYDVLKKNNIFSRKYFYPLISELPMYSSLKSARRDRLKVAFNTANRILCLPIYPDLEDDDLSKIITIIRGYR